MGNILKNEKKWMFISGSLYMIGALLEIMFAFLLSNIINGATTGNINKLIMNVVYSVFILGGCLIIYWCAINARRKYVMINITTIKEKLFNSFYRRGLSKFKKNDDSYYLNIISNDMDILETNYFLQKPTVFYYIGQFIFAIIALVYISWKAMLAFLILFFLPLLVPQFLNNTLLRRKKRVSEGNEKFTFEIKEQIQGIETIITNLSVKNYFDKFKKVNLSQQIRKKDAGVIENFVRQLSGICGFIAQIGCMGIGGILVIKGEINVGELIAAIQLLNSVFNPINVLSEIIALMKSTEPIREKIIGEINVEESKQNSYMVGENTDIRYEELCVCYDGDKNVVENFTCAFKNEGISAVIGNSGCGKTTIFKCLLNIYGDYTGIIKLGNINIRDISPNEIYRYVGYVPQNVYIFNDTIRNNITLGGRYTSQEYNEVIEKVGLKELVNSQYGDIGDNGESISGGEKQRIGLARVLLRKPKIIIFDEPTSALDPTTRNVINEMIFNLKGVTRIVITHDRREEYLEKFDEVICIE